MTGGIPLPRHDQLTAESLRALAAGEIELIWHRGFYPAEFCDEALPRIVRHCEGSWSTLAADYQVIGVGLGEAVETADGERRYLATAAKTTALIRNVIFAGRPSPCDLLRLQLDELWPAGASVARSKGRMLLPSIVRRWPAGGHANPHIDQRDGVELLAEYHLSRRLGANIYVEVPPPGFGGEIDFWEICEREEEYRSARRPDYGLDRDQLGAPLCSISPGKGDLLIFDAARIHGVRAVDQGSRVTAACFIGVQEVNAPLLVFA